MRDRTRSCFANSRSPRARVRAHTYTRCARWRARARAIIVYIMVLDPLRCVRPAAPRGASNLGISSLVPGIGSYWYVSTEIAFCTRCVCVNGMYTLVPVLLVQSTKLLRLKPVLIYILQYEITYVRLSRRRHDRDIPSYPRVPAPATSSHIGM